MNAGSEVTDITFVNMRAYVRSNRNMIIVLSIFALWVACTKVPISGRKQLNLIPEHEMMSMSYSAYQSFLDTSKVLPASDQRVVLVRSIGSRIQTAVESYMASIGQTDRLKGFQWEFNVVDEDVVNAWCMPGGKVVVYTGILPVTQDETSLAVVMGHEIAHAIARHGNERMSQGLAVQLGGVALSVALSEKSEQTQNIFIQSYGVGATLGVLAYSRQHETEADKLGLVFMAMAKYNPASAIAFWERMAASGGPKPPQILSTHPSDQTRIQNLKAFMPEALKYYQP